MTSAKHITRYVVQYRLSINTDEWKDYGFPYDLFSQADDYAKELEGYDGTYFRVVERVIIDTVIKDETGRYLLNRTGR